MTSDSVDRESPDLEEMKETFAQLSTEALLEQIVDEGEEFRPEALALMEEELRRRGVSRGQIEERRASRPHHPGSDEEPEGGRRVAVAAFEQEIFAEQAADVLQKQGIEAYVYHRAKLGPEFPTPDVDGTHLLLVAEQEEGRARLFLEGFAPAAKEDDEED
jgi:hypothetical protein